MGHTKKHNRRNNKNRQTKKYKGRGGGEEVKGEGENRSTTWGWLSNKISNKIKRITNSTDLNKEANDLFGELDTSKDGKLSKEEYEGVFVKKTKMPQFDTMNDAGVGDGIDLNKFTAAYYFAEVADNDDNIDDNGYKKLQKILPGAANIHYLYVAGNNLSNNGVLAHRAYYYSKITFEQFLSLYYFLEVADNYSKIDSDGYKKLQGMLPGAENIPYEEVNEKNDIIFIKFVPFYYFLKAYSRDSDTNSINIRYKTFQENLPDLKNYSPERITWYQYESLYYFVKYPSDNDDTINARIQKLLKKSKVTFDQYLPAYYFQYLPAYYFLSLAGNADNIDATKYERFEIIYPGALGLKFKFVAGGKKEINFTDFLPIYYFASVREPKFGDAIDFNEYHTLQNRLLKFKKVNFDELKKVINYEHIIYFNKFLDKYNELYPPTQPNTGGRRRRRKRSTRNKRKSNKKRRTVKRRKSAKKSHRRK